MMSPTTMPGIKSGLEASLSLPGFLTSEYRYHRFVDSLYLLLLEYIACEEGCDEEHDHNKQRP